MAILRGRCNLATLPTHRFKECPSSLVYRRRYLRMQKKAKEFQSDDNSNQKLALPDSESETHQEKLSEATTTSTPQSSMHKQFLPKAAAFKKKKKNKKNKKKLQLVMKLKATT